MIERLYQLNASLGESQKVRWGVAFLVVGTIVIGLLALGSLPSFALEIVLGIIGVLLMVAGSLSLGTSDSKGRVV